MDKLEILFQINPDKDEISLKELETNHKIFMIRPEDMPPIQLTIFLTLLKAPRDQLRMLLPMLQEPFKKRAAPNLKAQLKRLKILHAITSLIRLTTQRTLSRLSEELQTQLEILLQRRKNRFKETHMESPNTLRTKDYSTIFTDQITLNLNIPFFFVE